MFPILPPQGQSIARAALGPDGRHVPPLGGGGLGGLKPPAPRPGIGDFGKPKASQANLSPLGMYLLNMHG